VITDKLTVEKKKTGFFNGLKVILLSLLRPFCYDQFSHIKINNVMKTLLSEVKTHCENGTMNAEIMEKLSGTIVILNENSKNKHSEMLKKTWQSIKNVYSEAKELAKKREQQQKETHDFHENISLNFPPAQQQFENGLHQAGEGIDYVKNQIGNGLHQVGEGIDYVKNQIGNGLNPVKDYFVSMFNQHVTDIIN